MTPPEDTQGKGNTDLNVQHRTMEQIMLDHMKLCHPEWLEELTESGELDDFIAVHVERAGDQYGRSVESGTQPLLAKERAMRDHLLIDPLGDCQKYYYGSDNNDEPVTQKRDVETAEVIQARASHPERPSSQRSPALAKYQTSRTQPIPPVDENFLVMTERRAGFPRHVVPQRCHPDKAEEWQVRGL